MRCRIAYLRWNMLRVWRNDAFACCVNERYAPDTDIYCAICGYGIYADEDVAWDDDGQICHEYCAERENEMNIKTPDKPSVWDWTVREQHEYCKARVAMQGGDCLGSNAKSCPLYAMCCECPDQWKESV